MSCRPPIVPPPFPAGAGGSVPSLALDDLTDVSAAAPTEGQVLTYDADTETWVAAAVPPAPFPALDDLQDVEITSPVTGHVLRYDGATWENDVVTHIQGRSVAATAPTGGQVLAWNDTAGNWYPNTLPAIPGNLDDLGDVDVPSPSSGQVLTYQGQWEAVTLGGDVSATTVDDVRVVKLRGKDISVIAPSTNGHVLTWDAGFNEWVPKAPAGGTPSGSAGGDLGGTYPNPTVEGLQGIDLVGTPDPDQILIYDNNDNTVKWKDNPGDIVARQAIFQERVAATVAGPSLAENTWTTCVLNTEVVNELGISLNAGTGEMTFPAPPAGYAYQVDTFAAVALNDDTAVVIAQALTRLSEGGSTVSYSEGTAALSYDSAGGVTSEACPVASTILTPLSPTVYTLEARAEISTIVPPGFVRGRANPITDRWIALVKVKLVKKT